MTIAPPSRTGPASSAGGPDGRGAEGVAAGSTHPPSAVVPASTARRRFGALIAFASRVVPVDADACTDFGSFLRLRGPAIPAGSSHGGRVAGGAWNASREALTIARPSRWLPPPPMTAPIPNGMRRPSTLPLWVTVKRLTNCFFSWSAIGPTADIGSTRPSCSPQNAVFAGPAPVACEASWVITCRPALPSTIAITRARARSGSSTGMPCTSVTDCAKSALASRNPAVWTADRASETPVVIAGTAAVAPTAAPPMVTAVR